MAGNLNRLSMLTTILSIQRARLCLRHWILHKRTTWGHEPGRVDCCLGQSGLLVHGQTPGLGIGGRKVTKARGGLSSGARPTTYINNRTTWRRTSQLYRGMLKRMPR
eukprot:5087677-Amphidinium_carterae.2